MLEYLVDIDQIKSFILKLELVDISLLEFKILKFFTWVLILACEMISAEKSIPTAFPFGINAANPAVMFPGPQPASSNCTPSFR